MINLVMGSKRLLTETKISWLQKLFTRKIQLNNCSVHVFEKGKSRILKHRENKCFRDLWAEFVFSGCLLSVSVGVTQAENCSRKTTEIFFCSSHTVDDDSSSMILVIQRADNYVLVEAEVGILPFLKNDEGC